MTLKDDGYEGTYYREYNKECNETGDKTLVGNWVEERALQGIEQSGRYAQWVQGGSPVLDSFSRTFGATDSTPGAREASSHEACNARSSCREKPHTTLIRRR